MPSNIFDRAMFKAENKPMKADSGIMQGFDDEGEIPEDEMMEEVSQRKPNSPEILMNNLRGDMRSVDARYQELADMVGEDVAMETPPEVLALLQAQLAQPPMGIGALPPGQGLSPPPMAAGAPPMPTPDMMGGMPQPGAMPQGPEGQMPPPQNFADGGMVNNALGAFSNSSQLTPFQGGMSASSAPSGGFGSFLKANMSPEQTAALNTQPVGNPYQTSKDMFGQTNFGAPSMSPGQYNNNLLQNLESQMSERFGPRDIGGQSAGMPLSSYLNQPAATPYNAVAPNTTNSSMGSVNGYGSGYGNQGGGFGSMGGGGGPFPLQGQYGIVKMAQGGIASLGNFSEGVAQAGRNGDTVLAHMTPEQHQYLTELGGGATVNPQTGLPEHFMGMQAIPQMMTNIGTRAAPYLQQANVLAGRALYNPTFSAPTLNQSRTTLGTFGPKVAEGLDVVYPTFTQGIANSRVGQMMAQGADRLSKTPAMAKAGAALMAIPGAGYIRDAFDNPNLSAANNNPPKIPGDRATGWTPPADEVIEGESTPIDYNNLPINPNAAPAAAPGSEAERNNQLIQNAIAKKTRGERLEEYMSENVPIFEKYLGGDKDYNQAQALFVLADMGLKLASTRKPGESFASAFARSAQGVPAGLSTIAAAEDQAKRQIKSAALTSGLQTIAAEDKAAADIAKAIATKTAQGQKMTYKDVGAGMSRVTDNNGKLIGYSVQQAVKDEFLNDPVVPLSRVDDKNFAVTNPYAKATPRPAPAVQTESLRGKIEAEQISSRDMVNLIDSTIQDIASVYGPGAFFTDFKNNVIVPVAPNMVASPDADFEGKRSRVALTLKEITTALAKSGDTGNIAVSERALAKGLTGKDPASFFADPELVMKNMMAIRTQLINNYYRKSAQLGHTDYDIKMDVPNLGTANDPIPYSKSGYLDIISGANPNATVYVKTKSGKIIQQNLSNRLPE